jgi:AraC family transcriptional regulator of adaptative response / DNA-3-methyladenine glycosylase II
MMLDFDTCYRAVVARDSRFDGRFFTGVTSTGIYCRPICPARTPARRNMRFFPHAGAAEAAGFRACRRCRPEASPGSPDWNARADLAARAVRLIADGYADEHGISGLARRLAVTERHLRRLLLAELGTTPIALARTTRLQTARRLLAETGMPVTEIAFASGFSSVRQFNASFREAYGRPPSQLRSRTPRSRPRMPGRARGGPAATADAHRAGSQTAHREAVADRTWLTLRLACREPFDGRSLLRFVAARAIPGVEEVSDGRYARTVRVPGGSGIIELIPPPSTGSGENGRSRRQSRAGEAQVLLRARLTGLRGVGQVMSRCRRLFDLDADQRRSPRWQPMGRSRRWSRRPSCGCPVRHGFELAVRAVLGQQVSVPAASTLTGRLAARHGSLAEAAAGAAGAPTVLFPLPRDLADADLSGLGLTTGRQVTLRALAAACADGRVNLDPGTDPVETAARLAELPGVGPWTVAYILMRAAGDPDAFPSSDLGLRRAMERLGCDRSARQWRPTGVPPPRFISGPRWPSLSPGPAGAMPTADLAATDG